MPPQVPVPTMHEIAEKAGVGKATVSLALRDDPRLRPETRKRIQKLAAKMGYKTNATVANLMAQLRASRTPKYQATLGVLNVSSDPKTLAGLATFRDWVRGSTSRATQLGYGLDHFWLHEPGIGPARLAKILESRNIRGLIVAALLTRSGLPEEFETVWKHFACVVVGVHPTSPPLNFAANDQYTTAFHAVHRLWEFGYRRVGLVMAPEVDEMVERRFSAGFWAGQESLPGSERIPFFPFHPTREIAFRAWYEEHRPDAVLCIHYEVKKWMEEMQLRVPEEIALAHLDWHEGLTDWAGMRQNNNLVGAAAIDVLVGQLHRNEFGLPEFPKSSFIQSTWVDGPSVTRKVTETAKKRK